MTTPLRRMLILALLAAAALAQPVFAASACPGATAPAAGKKQLNILLIGANGMIGSRVLNEATSRGHCVIGASRHPDKIAKGLNVHAVELNATNQDAIAKLAKDADVIVSATSPRGGGDPAKEAKAVGDAAIAAAKATGKRLFVVGGAGSLLLPNGKLLADSLPVAYRGEALAMKGVLDSLKASDIDWTFFSPASSIAPGTKTGKYRLGTATLLTNEKGDSKISAEDYADALVNELEKPAHRRSQMTIAY
ncbi:MAG: NAD(P)H-binding protein [Gammaproteobacteria bacterium]